MPVYAEATRIGLVAVAASLTWFGALPPWRGFAVIPLLVALIGGYPIFREALSSLGQRKMTMELSMTIAILAALAIGESFTSLVIVLFVLIAEVLEHLTISRGRRAVGALLRVLPAQSTVLRGGLAQEIPIGELQRGDLVLIRPGARIPVDGLVMSGHSFVDQSTITGESLPVEKLHGGKIYAGTINQSGTLQVQTLEVGRDTAFGKIIEAVERAEQSRAPIQKTSDRLAGFLVYFALAAAGLTFFVTRDIRSTIAVVIVAGACGIAAGTPLAIFGAIGRAAKSGAIIKGGLHLEALWRVDTILLDKTGTLTLGRPEVVELRPAAGVTEVELLRAAATAEGPSEHPLGRSILARAKSIGLLPSEADAFDYTPGEGIVCLSQGKELVVGNRLFFLKRGIDAAGCPPVAPHLSEVLVARQKRPLGSIGIADVLRPEAKQAVQNLKQLGLRISLLTGDASPIATAVGKQLQVDQVLAEMLPEAKLEHVKSLRANGRKVAIVGDGINDAAAMMAADVGVAMGSGTEIARESAGILLLGDDLLVLATTFQVARRCQRIIMQNFYGTLGIDALGILLAGFGLLSPLWAAFIHVSSELAFILNSTRLLPGLTPSAAPSGL
jgi:Cd2+/Zn2+-exporting ATPase/Cu+-exporting ATPase